LLMSPSTKLTSAPAASASSWPYASMAGLPSSAQTAVPDRASRTACRAGPQLRRGRERPARRERHAKTTASCCVHRRVVVVAADAHVCIGRLLQFAPTQAPAACSAAGRGSDVCRRRARIRPPPQSPCSQRPHHTAVACHTCRLLCRCQNRCCSPCWRPSAPGQRLRGCRALRPQ
jgi:hypothetical protein